MNVYFYRLLLYFKLIAVMLIINIGTKQNSKRIFFNFLIENNPFISLTTIHRAVDGEL